MQNYQDILKQIQNKNFSPFYLFSGTSPYFIDRLIDALTAALVKEETAAFDHTVLYGKECTVSQIIEIAKRFPVLAPYQLVVIKEAQYMDKQLDDLAAYVEQSTPSTILAFCWKNKPFDKRKKLYKAAQNKGVVFESKPLYDNQIEPWLTNQAIAYGLRLSPESVVLLHEFIGANLQQIDKALEKLQLVGSKDQIIEAETIEYHIGISKEYNHFELQKAIGSKNFSQAVKICDYLSENQKHYPLVVTISSLFRYFERLMQYHALDDKQQAAKTMGISPYFLSEYQLASQHFSMKQCSKALEVIFEADLKSKGIKGGGQTVDAILKQLLIDLWV